MRHSFDTIALAVEAGYTSGCVCVLEQMNGYEIRVVDVSGPDSYGYAYAVMARADDENGPALGPWGNTVTVATNDPNQLGERDSFIPMFAPGVLEQATREAREAICQAVGK